jgi:hypothetical protein
MKTKDEKYFIAFWIVAVILFIFLSLTAKSQDTASVTIAIEDTTFHPDLYYWVEDAYTDDIDSSKISNEYYQEVPGWEIDGMYYDWRFQPFEGKYKVLNSWPRPWETVQDNARQEMRHDGQDFVIYNSRKIYFQQPGYSK